MVTEDIPLSYTKAVGERLRTLRKQRGLSLLAVEESTGREFKASVLGAYERGERVISVLRLQRLASFYRVPVDQILPRPATGEGDGSTAATTPFTPRRPVVIDLVRLSETESIEGQVIRRYISSIHSHRSGMHGDTMPIRDDDLRALGRFFDCDERTMEMKLVELRLRY